MDAFLTATVLWLVAAHDPTPRTWDVDGVKREALVYAPSKKTEGKAPLVFDFHGHGGTARHAAKTHHIHETWPEAVVVYMQGIPTPGLLTDREGADRFARASFYVSAIPKDEEPVKALASVFSVIRNVSVPFGITMPNEPNISSTRWRTVADHKRKLYFFESALTPNTFWVDLKQVEHGLVELGRVDEQGHHHDLALLARAPDERQMSLVQRSHRGDEPDRVPRAR